MKVHELKCENPFFSDIWNSKKFFEIRKDDREYKNDDYVLLREYSKSENTFLKRSIYARIIYKMTSEQHEGINKGFCILQLDVIDKQGKR